MSKQSGTEGVEFCELKVSVGFNFFCHVLAFTFYFYVKILKISLFNVQAYFNIFTVKI